jgi:phage gp36-like protein
MPYAAAQDMIDRFTARTMAEVTTDAGDVPDTAVLDRALSDASNLIDGYLQARYPLPLASVPAQLTLHACNIAFYQLLAARPLGDVEDVRQRYDDAITYLTKVSEGKILLGLAEDQAPAEEHGALKLAGPPKRFGRENLGGF